MCSYIELITPIFESEGPKARGTAWNKDPQGLPCDPQTPCPAPSTSSSGSRTMGRGGWGHPVCIISTPRTLR